MWQSLKRWLTKPMALMMTSHPWREEYPQSRHMIQWIAEMNWKIRPHGQLCQKRCDDWKLLKRWPSSSRAEPDAPKHRTVFSLKRPVERLWPSVMTSLSRRLRCFPLEATLRLTIHPKVVSLSFALRTFRKSQFLSATLKKWLSVWTSTHCEFK